MDARRIPSLSITDAKILVAIAFTIFGWPSFATSLVLAQGTSVVPTTGAGDLGTTVTPHGQTFQITGGTRPGNGTNLFHSFDQFNVGGGDTAQFLNTTPSLPTSNILSRVTGDNPSSIFGTIQTTGFGDANLFLMNPSGIVFGPNATLKVGGSVNFTTADYLRLKETTGSSAGLFYANPSAASLLSNSPVAAFGFLGNPASIILQESILGVPPGKSISLVGGNITIQSSMLGNSSDSPPSAPGNQVLIASVASPGEILAGTLDRALNTNSQAFVGLGTVQISHKSTIDTRGESGGKVLIRAGQLIVDDSTIGSNTGDVHLDANSILVKSGARLITFTTAPENAGNITLTASRNIEMDSSASIQSLSQGALGNAGNVTLRTTQGNIHFTNGASITSQTSNGSGSSGSIEVDAQHGDIRLENSTIFTSAGGGTGTIKGIRISANNLELLKGARIDGDNFSKQVAGNIDVQIRGLLKLAGGSEIETTTVGTAPAADLIIRARDILITDGGSLSINTEGPGNAGNIKINADSLTVASGGRIQASTSGTGAGGSIAIKTTSDITVTGLSANDQDRSGIFAKTQSSGGGNNSGSGGGGDSSGGGSGDGSGGGASKPGKAGDITIEAKNLLLNGGAQIDSSTTSGGPGGNISIKTTENITIAGSSTRLTSDATRGDGKGGSLTLVAKNITVGDNASMTAATGGKGDAGNISLTAIDQLLLQSAGKVTTSTSGSGKGGTITIQANQVLLEGQGTRISADTLPPFADMTITINILHTHVGDLIVRLDSPTGTRVALLSRVGGNGQNFVGTQFNDQAPTPTASGSAPFTGTFTPREPLGQLNNELVAGNWTLNVQDQTTGNVGSLESWTLQIGDQTFRSSGGPINIPDNGGKSSTITVSNPTVPTVPGVGESPGIGGNIALTAVQAVSIRDGASITASSTGTGAAGNIEIDAGREFDVQRGSITTQANELNGGNINIRAIDLIRIVDGKISTSALNGGGNGGNISIDPKVVLLQGSEVLAQANRGTGGDISITTPVFIADQASRIDASTPFGLNGRITIQSPTSNLSGTVGQLVSKTSPPQVLLQNRCVALAGGEQSTFFLTGRETLPGEPSGWLSSPVSMEHWTGEEAAHASRLMVRNRELNASPVMTAQTSRPPVLSLRRLTPPGFLVRTFAAGATGCPS